MYACVDEIRARDNPRHWIEVFRLRLDDPTAMVVAMPAQRAERQAEEERQKQEALLRDQRAVQNRKLAKEAAAWEAQHALPEITGASTRQVNFARRCRYQLCSTAPGQACQKPTDAPYWIAKFVEAEHGVEAEHR